MLTAWLTNLDPRIAAALIAAVTSTVLTPIVQVVVGMLKERKAYEEKIAPIVAHIRILQGELLQIPINRNMQGVKERIEVIENFYHPMFNDLQKHCIKTTYIQNAKHLEARHQHSREWMQIEYPEEELTFNNSTARLLAVLQKKSIPELFDPSDD